MAMKWFRSYDGDLDSDWIEWCTLQRDCNVATCFGVWKALESLASRSPKRGVLLIADGLPYTSKAIAKKCGIDEEILNGLLNEFQSVGEISIDDGVISISHWDERQFTSDNATARSTRHRNVKVQQHCNVASPLHATTLQRDCNAPDTDTDTDTDITTWTLAKLYESFKVGVFCSADKKRLASWVFQYGESAVRKILSNAYELNKQNDIATHVKKIDAWTVAGLEANKKKEAQPQKPKFNEREVTVDGNLYYVPIELANDLDNIKELSMRKRRVANYTAVTS